ncbi:toll/interleukin-1 receptor domain-containing protein [Bradyrhizobium guangdongense]|uniref:TIR domain-containing protein n=1 Tax=Bradyrhizobium guangdongense TaxID=1325090 RepID=A0ABX6UA70_9BRAD|nr:toll/interleukin-1 receptor domain-containing protein [Bradyrhizobium guangdongense]QAU37151.1 hypothetical protein X265_05210 [Bradyrhizobium guangdongense]QOZ58205.1 hypothetical protein XH86_05205 [Bradyrhizobium guangdongense]
MAYDDESIGAAPWKPGYGARVFKYDAILSYRRADADAVHRLAELLHGLGLSLWWDENGDEDLSDGQLLERIGHALFHARYIVVCLSTKAALSEWMTAEFATGLAAETEWSYKRVLVVKMEPEVTVPANLASCVAFDLQNPAELAEFVKTGNRFDFEPDEVKAAVSRKFFDFDIAEVMKSGNKKLSNVDLLLGLPWRISTRDSDEPCQSLMSMRCSVDRMDRSELEAVPGLSSMLLRACFEPAMSKNNDNRANAIGTMARLAELGDPQARDRLIFFLSTERDAGVISMAFRWISGHYGRLEGHARSVVLLAIATASTFAHGRLDEVCLSSLPEAIQCRVRTGRDLNSDSLSPRERLALASRCIKALLKQTPTGANSVWIAREAERVSKAAFEFYKSEPHPRAAHPELISQALDVIDVIIERSREKEGYPLCTIDAAFDQLMTPLAMCYADGQCPEHAARLFESGCDLISAYGKRGENTVAAFRRLLSDLKQGRTFNEAYARLPESLFQASKLDYEIARRADFERLRAEGIFK